ncbi:MAG: hypothetical protein IJG94_11085 [Clostridia bacterium]|nr:hypothetical protein [Clostridia bacterium]
MNQDQPSNFYPGQNPQQGSPNGYPYPTPGYPYAPSGTAQYGYPGQGSYQQPGQGGYAAPQQGGYASPQPTGYPQNPYYSSVPQGGYNPAGDPAGTQQQGYTPYPGTAAPGYDPGQGYPGGAYANPQAGGYIPQAPNYTQGYNNTGYAPYPGYQTAQNNPYGQMGREPENPPKTVPQVPLNGGGYIPPPVPVRKRPFVMKDLYLIIGSGVLLLLFAAGMFIPGMGTMKWVFLVLAAACIALLWVRPLTEANKKICFTVVFGALCAVSVISMLGIGQGTPDAQNTGKGGTGGQNPPVVTTNPASGAGSAPGVTAAVATSTPEPDNNSAVINRLYQFFQYWSANQTDEMLTLCSPTWQSRTDNAKADLFGLLANRTPLDYNFENISGTANDQSRTVTLNSLMDRNNGKDPSRYRLNVIMVKENDDQWFVDPQSLQTYEAADTPDPNVTATPSPTPEMKAEPNTVLYYNPDGGTKYHLDQNCKSTHKKYLPMKGHFTYSEINKDPYVKLSPCNVCGAPLR